MSCDVTADCLEYALTSDIRQGIWGGLSAHQRKRLQAERGAA
jgi:WhiB family redox-sensing transcriptional regulator